MPVSYLRESQADGIAYTSIVDEKFKTNLIRIRLITPLRMETASDHAVALGVIGVSNREYPDLSALTARLNELYGANIGVDIARRGDLQILSVSVSAIDNRFALEGEDITGEAVRILLNCVFAPNLEGNAFGEEVFRSRKKELLDAVEAEINNKRGYALLQAQKTVYAGEPAMLSSYGTRETAEAVTAEAAYAAYKRLLETAQIEIYSVSAAPLPQVKEQIQTAFATIDRHPEQIAYTAASPLKPEPKTVIDPMDVGQSKLVMGFKTDVEDIHLMRLLNAMFGGTVSSKLFLNVREKLSLCYYCASNYIDSKRTMLVDSGVELANYETARDEILRQLDALRSGDFTDEEMDSALLSLVNSVRGTGDTPSGWVGWYFYLLCSGLDRTPQQEAEYYRSMFADRQKLRQRLMDAAKSLQLDTVYLMQQREGE